jgi:hypothetical protein
LRGCTFGLGLAGNLDSTRTVLPNEDLGTFLMLPSARAGRGFRTNIDEAMQEIANID